MIYQVQTFWEVQTSAELVNFLAVFLRGSLGKLQIVAIVVFITREILHIHWVMLLAATQSEMLWDQPPHCIQEWPWRWISKLPGFPQSFFFLSD